MRSLSFLLKRAALLLVAINLVYLLLCLIYYKDFSFKAIYSPNSFNYKYIHDESDEPSISFQAELEELFAKVEKSDSSVFWLRDTTTLNSEAVVDPNLFVADLLNQDAWINKNTLFYDVRVTLALYLNHIKNQLTVPVELDDTAVGQADNKADDIAAGDQGGEQALEERVVGRDENNVDAEKVNTEKPGRISVPFNWMDWVDLSYLNDELTLPVEQRRTCQWFEHHIDKGNNYHFRHLKCTDNELLTSKEIKDLGFEHHQQLPGYVIHDHSLNKGTIDVRLAQARSYLMTHMPNPFKIIFLNQDSGTYEVDVDQGLPHKRIIKSDLMEEYLLSKGSIKQKGDKFPSKVKLDPVKEFNELKESVKPTLISNEEDLYSINRLTHTFKPDLSKFLPLPESAFHYTPEVVDTQIAKYKAKGNLDYAEQSYLNSLLLSRARNTNTEDVYFRQATLINDKTNTDHDKGYHYDWRFFVGTLNGARKGWVQDEFTLRQEVILDRLTRSWFRFAHEKGLVSWIMHGPLLSWYWNGLMFPFDNDLDIQMPASDLARLGELYNQTLVIEDINEGFGKYLVDVGTFVHNRDISRRENHIDARFIDVDTGLYIDITGLSVSTADIPHNFAQDTLLNVHEDQGPIYNDRRKHFYKHEQLSPLKYSMLGGVPVFVPNDITNRLIFEYPNGISSPEYDHWYFIPRINMWVHKDKLTVAFDDNDFKLITHNSAHIDSEKLNNLILTMDESQVLQLLKKDDEVLTEYYKTKEITDIHQREKEFLFSTEQVKEENEENPEPNINEVSDRVLTGKDYDDYNKFVNEKIKMLKPLRSSLFQYENINHKKHHEEFVEIEENHEKLLLK